MMSLNPRRQAALTYLVTSSLLAMAWRVHFVRGLWVLNGAAASLGIALACSSLSKGTRIGGKRPGRDIWVGASLGLALTSITHALASVILPHWRGLHLETQRLYGMIDDARNSLPALAVILLVVVAEEFVYRGVVTTALSERLGRSGTVVCSAALYALPVSASGSWLLVAIAVALGTLWTVARLWSEGLIVSLISHAIWSASTFVLLPIQ
ncbi:MAG TPA: type II CAAX endopeptidase family protein [Polyangiaceae bacterium]